MSKAYETIHGNPPPKIFPEQKELLQFSETEGPEGKVMEQPNEVVPEYIDLGKNKLGFQVSLDTTSSQVPSTYSHIVTPEEGPSERDTGLGMEWPLGENIEEKNQSARERLKAKLAQYVDKHHTGFWWLSTSKMTN